LKEGMVGLYFYLFLPFL